MKIMSFVFALLCVGVAWAKPDAGLFSKAIREGIQEDSKASNVSVQGPGRAPASIEPTQAEYIQQEQKSLNKVEKQYKQLGSPSW